MTNQADAHLPEELAEKVARALFEADPERTREWDELGDWLQGTWLEESADFLTAALPSLIDHFRERLLSDEAVEADARARWLGKPKAQARKQSRLGLEAALATAFKDNTDSLGGEDGD